MSKTSFRSNYDYIISLIMQFSNCQMQTVVTAKPMEIGPRRRMRKKRGVKNASMTPKVGRNDKKSQSKRKEILYRHHLASNSSI